MEEIEYIKMFEIEDDHWWFRGVRLHLAEVLWDRLKGMPLLLDAGCGSGGNLEWLQKLGFHAMGFDLSLTGAKYSRGRNLANVLAADINQMPYGNETFDGILCCNVFECAEVDEAAALAEISRVLRPGGFALLTLSARSALAVSHDKAVHCVRRYTEHDIRKKFSGAGFRVQSLRPIFGTLAPVLIFYRSLRWVLSKANGEASAGSDLFMLPSIFNQLLFAWAKLDAFINGCISLPFGSTYLVLLEKPRE